MRKQNVGVASDLPYNRAPVPISTITIALPRLQTLTPETPHQPTLTPAGSSKAKVRPPLLNAHTISVQTMFAAQGTVNIGTYGTITNVNSAPDESGMETSPDVSPGQTAVGRAGNYDVIMMVDRRSDVTSKWTVG